MQRHAVANRNFLFDDGRVRSVADVTHGVVLDVGAIANADVMNVAAYRAIAPDRRLVPEMYVTYHLSARVDVGCRVNLWVDPTKRSNHDFADSNTASFERH